MNRRIFITGYGIITSIGNDAKENYQSLISGSCGYGRLEILETALRDEIPACEIKLTDHQLCTIAEISPGHGFTRTSLLGLIALKEAIAHAGLTKAEINESGLLSATTTGGIRELERYYYDLQDSGRTGEFTQFRDTANPGEHTERLAEETGIRKYVGTVSTACSSSANSIMYGAQLIASNQLDRVICGGAEALSKFTINGFNSLMILDHNQCKPFDQFRKGLNLGEGAAYLVLESEGAVRRAGRTPVAALIGFGNANDAFHLTASSPEGAGALKAMNMALQNASVAPSQIDYINAHGTATENNDLSEGLAIQKLFGDTVPRFSSTKPYTGHTLAAAGSIEAVFCMMALRHKVIFPSINFNTPMEELHIFPEKELIQNATLQYALSNSFGFGGNTSSLLFASN